MVVTELLLKDEVYSVIGAVIEVHRELGSGFVEAVYQEAFEIELTAGQIPFDAQKPVKVTYKGRPLSKEFVPDLVCYGQLIVELKALDKLGSKEEAQILNCLKASGFRVGLLINFGAVGKLEWKRYIR